MRGRRGTRGCALALVWGVAFAVGVAADVRLPSIIGSTMVLQRGEPVPIWGWAEPGESVTVMIAEQTCGTQADDAGRWRIMLAPISGKGPFETRVSGRNTIVLTNILVGEVWICSGQSNMGMSLGACSNAASEIAKAVFPEIRLFTVKHTVAREPREDCEGSWQSCSPESASRFSGVGYFFGRELHRELDVPVGLIDSSWGGTPAEAWTRAALLRELGYGYLFDNVERWAKGWNAESQEQRYQEKLAGWKNEADAAKADNKRLPRRPRRPIHPHRRTNQPGVLFNGMIQPLIPYRIRGAIWYQGEANAGRAYKYRTLFPAMIQDWRRAWGQGSFPFLAVQLASYTRPSSQPGESVWAELREAQLEALRLPNTAVAIAIDIGDAIDIHPKNKQDVGKRLALAARHDVYGHEIVGSGPLYDSMTVEAGSIRIRFRETGSGLCARGGESLKRFAIAGKDRKFVWAGASIEGNTVLVSSAAILNPVAVRYAWAHNPEGCNLYNNEGLPASPFRTDQWPGKTWPKK